SSEDTSDYGTRWDNIRKAIQQMKKPQFTQSDVEEQIQQISPGIDIDRSRLRSTLWIFQSKGELIKQVRKGNNQEPALFERLLDTNSHATNGTKANGMERSVSTNSGIISIGQVESYLSKSSKRLSEIAEHFHVEEGTIRQLIGGSARIVEGERGWV